MTFIKNSLLRYAMAMYFLQMLLSPVALSASFQQLPPDISFMIIDLKYRSGALKVCEFGEGFLSGFVGHAMLYGQGKVSAAAWNFFQSFNKPMVCFTDRAMPSRLGLQIEPLHFLQSKKYRAVRPERLSDIELLAVSYGSKAFFERYNMAGGLSTGILAIDYAIRPFALNKGYMHTLFAGDQQVERYRPACRVLRREYTPELAVKIITEIPADAYVIKPINGWKGQGILIVQPSELDVNLKEILPSATHAVGSHVAYWSTTQTEHFIIESLEHSLVIKRGAEYFDPTMRVILGLWHNAGDVGMNILGAYWKMPTSSLYGKRSSLNDKFISHILPKNKRSSAKVSPAVLAGVERELRQFVPHVYKKMIAISHSNEFLRRLSNECS